MWERGGGQKILHRCFISAGLKLLCNSWGDDSIVLWHSLQRSLNKGEKLLTCWHLISNNLHAIIMKILRMLSLIVNVKITSHQNVSSCAHTLQSTSCFVLFFLGRWKCVSKHLAQMSHCETAVQGGRDCKILLNLDHLCLVLVLDGFRIRFPPPRPEDIFTQKKTTLGRIVEHARGIFDLLPPRSSRNG